mmetsp:Transcript_16815/g.48664  ORF Transcript_16815/g.48664 Transcript_16815/m.48664 type:complete len:239 (+) Transcript_16815:2951-3667(+)
MTANLLLSAAIACCNLAAYTLIARCPKGSPTGCAFKACASREKWARHVASIWTALPVLYATPENARTDRPAQSVTVHTIACMDAGKENARVAKLARTVTKLRSARCLMGSITQCAATTCASREQGMHRVASSQIANGDAGKMDAQTARLARCATTHRIAWCPTGSRTRCAVMTCASREQRVRRAALIRIALPALSAVGIQVKNRRCALPLLHARALQIAPLQVLNSRCALTAFANKGA